MHTKRDIEAITGPIEKKSTKSVLKSKQFDFYIYAFRVSFKNTLRPKRSLHEVGENTVLII